MQNKQDPFVAREALVYELCVDFASSIRERRTNTFEDNFGFSQLARLYIQSIPKHVQKILVCDSLSNFWKISS